MEREMISSSNDDGEQFGKLLIREIRRSAFQWSVRDFSRDYRIIILWNKDRAERKEYITSRFLYASQ